MLGDKLRTLRSEKNITQKQMAELLNITQPSYSMYESNKRTPDYQTLQRIADVFGITVDQLISGTSHIQQSQNKPESPNYHKAEGFGDLKSEDKKKVLEYIALLKLKYDKSED